MLFLFFLLFEVVWMPMKRWFKDGLVIRDMIEMWNFERNLEIKQKVCQ